MYKEFQQILHDEQPYTFLYVGKRVSAVHRRFHGVEVFPTGSARPIGGCHRPAEIRQPLYRPVNCHSHDRLFCATLAADDTDLYRHHLIVFLIVRLRPAIRRNCARPADSAPPRAPEFRSIRNGAVDEAMAQWRAQYGLDKPLYVQYAVWLKNIFTLSFGDSFKDSQPVWGKIAERCR